MQLRGFPFFLVCSQNISVILSPPADFIVSSLTVNPIRIQTGDMVSVVWEVTNAGNGFPDASFWYDLVVSHSYFTFRCLFNG